MHELVAPPLATPPLERYGPPEYVKGDSPAAGAMFSSEIGGGFWTRLLSVHVRLVTDANVANRTVLVEYRDDGDNRYMISGAPVTQAASTTTDWTFDVFQAQAEWTIDDTVVVPLKPLLLLPGHDFRIFVDNVQATDQLSRIRFWRERFYPGNAIGLPE